MIKYPKHIEGIETKNQDENISYERRFIYQKSVYCRYALAHSE